MFKEQKTKTRLGVGGGMFLQFVGSFLSEAGESGIMLGAVLAPPLLLAGIVMFVWGCMNYTEGMGYSRRLGWLGLLSFIGMMILAFLPDRNSKANDRTA